MNNYCTNCGKKLEENAIKCEECNTYVIDLKEINKNKIFKRIKTIVILIVIGIISSVVIYTLYYKFLHRSLYNKYLKENFKDAQYIGYDSCRKCDGSCDGSCINSPKIVGCFKYYYKSDPNIAKSDITIYSKRGEVSIDTYSYIIKKYGFIENNESYNMYQTKRRSYLYIAANYINGNNITNIYKMVSEIIENYKTDDKYYLEINIRDNNNKYINISNRQTNNKDDFVWTFDNYKDIKILNPSLNDVIRRYNPFNNTYNSTIGGNNYND